MKIAAAIGFYVLFAIGAVRMFKGLTHLWPLLFGNKETQPLQQPNGTKYYHFEASAPMDSAQTITMIVTGLLAIAVAFYIRKKWGPDQPNT
jgi:hypothetical protein